MTTPQSMREKLVEELLEKHVHPIPDGDSIKHEFYPLRHEIEEDIITLIIAREAAARAEEQQQIIKLAQRLHQAIHTLNLSQEEQGGYMKAIADVIENQIAALTPTNPPNTQV